MIAPDLAASMDLRPNAWQCPQSMEPGRIQRGSRRLRRRGAPPAGKLSSAMGWTGRPPAGFTKHKGNLLKYADIRKYAQRLDELCGLAG